MRRKERGWCLVRLTSVGDFSGRESVSSERTVRDSGRDDSSLHSWKQRIRHGPGLVEVFVFAFSMRPLTCIYSGMAGGDS